MNFEIIIFPYWCIFAAFVTVALYIYKTKIIPTLKKYGRDYESYWSFSKQRKQLADYRNVCEKHGMSMKYWRFMNSYPKVGVILLFGWVTLLILAERQRN